MKNNKFKLFLKNPMWLIVFFNNRGLHFFSDKYYLKILYRLTFGKKLNLKEPKTFNEKIQWLKLYDRNDVYTKMVDKYDVKEYVSKIIGDKYIIPTLGVYDRFEDIDFDILPNSFVIKCTHDSGGLVIVKDKKNMDYKKSKNKIEKCLKRNFYYSSREWPYKNVKPRIIIEKYMSNNDKDIDDYKIHNFNGVPKIILVCKDRFEKTGLTEDFFDEKWNHLDIKRPKHGNSKKTILKPKKLDEMLALSKKLSNNIPFVRTDFYIINDKLYFGEITFFPASGFENFIPETWDNELGDYIKI